MENISENSSYETRCAYSDYLQSYNWDYFLTATFRGSWRDSLKASDAVWEALYGCNAQRAFLAVEKHRYPNWNCHVHGLVSGYSPGWEPPMLLPWEIWQTLFQRFGRSQVSAVRSIEDVASYCSKYVVKRMSHYGFYGQTMFWRNGY
jgi:hypothetical protein